MKSKRSFEPNRYLTISQDHLVTLSLWFLLEDGVESSFENLVAEAFSTFPDRFQLEGYPEWPNANIVAKSWVRCRTDKKWISGATSEGFALTPLGEQIATTTLKALGYEGRSSQSYKKSGSRQTISSRYVLRVENSAAYQKFKISRTEDISEYEFCDLLYTTLESTPETISNNFMQIKQQVEAFGRTDLVEFLEVLRGKFAGRFMGKRVRGGLMPQKKEHK
jgi:hypothetical protein